MKHRLLILGTLGEFVQLVCKAREKGYYTIVCDGYPDGPAMVHEGGGTGVAGGGKESGTSAEGRGIDRYRSVHLNGVWWRTGKA